ncbi:MAG: CPBP family intramembrane metalloprotease [Bacteroidaceae bacterium]|nr:CPBP family intramembrane metalloprotease [Bacteroidaceae bacterium]
MKKYLFLLAKLIVFAILFSIFLMIMVLPLAFTNLMEETRPSTSALIIYEAVQVVAVWASAWIIIRFWDKLSFIDDMGFRWQYQGKDFFYGLLVAVGIYAIGYTLSLLAGWISIVGVQFDVLGLLSSLLLMLLVAFAEESMVRGFVLGHMLDVGMNKYLALVLSSLIFASLHLGNPGITAFSFCNITLAGILLGVAYTYTRNLWFPISLHLFWNYIQGPILGYQVSGTDSTNTLVKLTISDNTLMNGGNFGFEASLPCTILMIIAIVLIIYYFENKKIQYEKPTHTMG